MKTFSPANAADELKDTAHVHYSAFWDLREIYREKKEQLFVLTAKAHANMHTILCSDSLHPNISWSGFLLKLLDTSWKMSLKMSLCMSS